MRSNGLIITLALLVEISGCRIEMGLGWLHMFIAKYYLYLYLGKFLGLNSLPRML